MSYDYEPSYDMFVGDPPEPEYPEPTLEEYCEGTGHELEDYVDPETGYQWCHCASVCLPVGGEPHDEYSAECASLIDAYHGLLMEQLRLDIIRRTEVVHGDEYPGLRYQLGKQLRHKTPEYLKALISSLNNSLGEAPDGGPWTESILDAYVLLGVHLRSIYYGALYSVLSGLEGGRDERGRYCTFDEAASRNLGIAKTLARFAVLIGQGAKSRQSHQLYEIFNIMLPVLNEKPEMVEQAAVMLNTQGVSAETAKRAAALLAEGIVAHPTVAEGLL